MMATLNHPGPDLLSDYALGRLDADDYFHVAEHLEQCNECQDTLTHLELPTDTLIRGLEGPPPAEPFVDEPECAAALQTIRRFGATSFTSAIADPPTPPPAIDSPHGMVRDYELLEPLGQGGMGMVYRARHMRLDRMVALKLLPAERTLQPQAVARFHREMKAIGNLDHPHIVRASDAGEVEGRHFLVMELVDGVDLGSLADQHGQMSVPDACELVRQAALGLDYAHRNGLVHRDVKPSNLMLDRTSVVKVLDLGLARLLEGEPCEPAELDPPLPLAQPRLPASAELTGASQALGTPDYMAPEQCRDSRAVDARTDVYGLAATLYRLLAGHAPYAGPRYDTVAKKIHGLLNDPVPPIDRDRRDLPAALVALVHRALARSPQDRPASASELATLLEPFCRGQNVYRLVDGSSPRETSAGRAGGRFRGALVALGGLGAVVALAIAIARIATPHGELTVEVPDAQARDKVRVEVCRGDQFHVLSSDPQQGWSIKLDQGVWDVKLHDPQQQFQLDATSVEITRHGRQVVRVTRRPKKATTVAPPVSPPVAIAKIPPPRAGTWRLTLPDGFTTTATLEALPESRYRLHTGGLLSGLYRWNARRLNVIDPVDDRFTALRWEWQDDALVLADELPGLPAGQRYKGSRLTFLESSPEAAATEAAPPAPEGWRILENFTPGAGRPHSDGSRFRFTATKSTAVNAFEVAAPDVDSGLVSLRAELKADHLQGRAWLELVCVWPDGSESVVAGVHNGVGEHDHNWKPCDALTLLEPGQRPKTLRGVVRIEGSGTVLVKNAQLLAKTLPGAEKPAGDVE